MTYLQTRGIYPCDLIDHLSIAHQEKSRYSRDDDIFCEFEGQLIHGHFVYRNFVDEFDREFFKEWGGDRLAGTCIATDGVWDAVFGKETNKGRATDRTTPETNWQRPAWKLNLEGLVWIVLGWKKIKIVSLPLSVYRMDIAQQNRETWGKNENFAYDVISWTRARLYAVMNNKIK
jgi:hypothetical protein